MEIERRRALAAVGCETVQRQCGVGSNGSARVLRRTERIWVLARLCHSLHLNFYVFIWVQSHSGLVGGRSRHDCDCLSRTRRERTTEDQTAKYATTSKHMKDAGTREVSLCVYSTRAVLFQHRGENVSKAHHWVPPTSRIRNMRS